MYLVLSTLTSSPMSLVAATKNSIAEEIKIPFGAESFVFQVAIQKFKDQYI